MTSSGRRSNLSLQCINHDQSHESRAYSEELRGSSYFVEKPLSTDYAELDKRLRSGDIKAA
jgi:ribosome-dependent ATPase